jgi:hypothetical protein
MAKKQKLEVTNCDLQRKRKTFKVDFTPDMVLSLL